MDTASSPPRHGRAAPEPPERGPLCHDERRLERLRAGLPDAATLRRQSDVAKALAHPGRLAVYLLVTEAPCCVCDVATVLEAPVSTASQHLNRLRRAGLATSEQRGKWVYYSAVEHPVAQAVVASVPRALRPSRRSARVEDAVA